MTVYRFQMDVQVVPERESDSIEAFTDELMEQLIALDPHADVQGSLTSGVLQISVTVEAAETFGAIDSARALIRTAAHVAGANTAGWQRTEDVWSWMLPTGSLHAEPTEALLPC